MTKWQVAGIALLSAVLAGQAAVTDRSNVRAAEGPMWCSDIPGCEGSIGCLAGIAMASHCTLTCIGGERIICSPGEEQQ